MYTLYSHMSDCFNQHAYLMILFDLFCVRSLVRSVHGVPARHATPPRQAHQPRCSRVVPTAWDRSKRRARKQSQLMATESANDRKIKNTKESNFSKAKQPQKWRCWNHGAFWVSSAWLNATSMNKKWQLSALLLAKQETGKQSVLHVSSSLGWELIWSMCPPCDAEKSQGCKLRRCLMTFVHVSHFVALVVFFQLLLVGRRLTAEVEPDSIDITVVGPNDQSSNRGSSIGWHWNTFMQTYDDMLHQKSYDGISRFTHPQYIHLQKARAKSKDIQSVRSLWLLTEPEYHPVVKKDLMFEVPLPYHAP